MIRMFAVVMLGLIMSGCTISELPQRKPGELIVVCPGGKVIINVDGNNCFDFMKLDESSGG